MDWIVNLGATQTSPKVARCPSIRTGAVRQDRFSRYRGRSFYRFDEFNGKTVDFVEVFTAGEYHAIDVRFQDKTALHFIIDPGFTLETEDADWKTGNWRPIKRWPLIHSESYRA
jgi:hypothetical protein